VVDEHGVNIRITLDTKVSSGGEPDEPPDFEEKLVPKEWVELTSYGVKVTGPMGLWDLHPWWRVRKVEEEFDD
jgi:hypothetical protein